MEINLGAKQYECITNGMNQVHLTYIITIGTTIITMSQATTPPRRVTFAPEVTTSPKSVVWDDPPLVELLDEHESQYDLPTLSEINVDLQKLVMQSAHSKAAYRGKLGKLSKELQDTKRRVQVLEDELRTARAKQAAAQQAIETARQRREDEAERLCIRRLQLQLMGRCMVDTEFLVDLQHVRENEISKSEKYEQLSSLELAVLRQRLEDIRAKLDKADSTKGGKGNDTAQSEVLRREAVSTFLLFHKFSQI